MPALLLALAALPLAAQNPGQDARNTRVPNTDTHFEMPRYASLKDWEARRAQLRTRILWAAGLTPMPEKTPLNAQVFGRIEREGYTIEKVLLETMPGFYLGGNLYRPARPGKYPGVVSPHGHWDRGRLEHQPLASIPGRGINLARQGYVVFTYDMVGYNDTGQTPHRWTGKAERLWNFTPLGLQLWNSIRATDFVASLPDVDPTRLAATGASGGGTQTFLLSAVDERIGFSAPVNMISAIMQGGCICENAPNLRLGAFNVEIASVIAPRPMLMVSATGDWTRNTPREEYPAVRGIYELYGKPDNVANVHIDAEHNYNRESREAVYRFFGKHILGVDDAARFSEREFTVESDENLLALAGGSLPAGALTFKQLFEQWKQTASRQAAGVRDPKTIRERLSMAFAAEWPAKVASRVDGEQIVLSRPGQGDRVPGLWFPGKGRPVVVVHPEGSAAARRSPATAKLIKRGRPVLLIDAFQTGAAIAPRDESHAHFLAFNLTADANRVQDILTALEYLGARKRGSVELIGTGRAGIWCLFASALAPAKVRLTAEMEGFEGTDSDFAGKFFVPGIQRAGGLKAAMKLAKPGGKR